MRCFLIYFPANNSLHILPDPVIQRICPCFRLCYVLCKIQRPTIALCFEKMSFMSSYWVEYLPAGINHLGALPKKELCRFTRPRYLFYIIYHQSAFKTDVSGMPELLRATESTVATGIQMNQRKQIICSQRNFNTVASPYAKLRFDLKESRKTVFAKCILAKLEYLDLSK
uniref:Uncharacterized protein n=1 Tax=Echinococcus canadensis TaxID=519352 RepID=A0A915EZ25_9CEST